MPYSGVLHVSVTSLTCGGFLHELSHGDWGEVRQFPLACGSGSGSFDSVWIHKAVQGGRSQLRGRLPASWVRSPLRRGEIKKSHNDTPTFRSSTQTRNYFICSWKGIFEKKVPLPSKDSSLSRAWERASFTLSVRDFQASVNRQEVYYAQGWIFL